MRRLAGKGKPWNDRKRTGMLPRDLKGRACLALVAALAAGCALAAPATAADPDGDALPTKWEKQRKKGMKLGKYGAKPKHKDVFVEIDYERDFDRSQVSCAELDQTYDVFKNAPVSNPDGRDGVRIHLDAGKSCPSRRYDLGGSNRFDATYSPPCAEIPDVTATQKRLKGFHFAGVESTCGGASEGSTNGQVMVLNGSFEFPHLLVHELGHNFGLDHAPAEGPNAISSMNMLITRDDDGNSPVTSTADYQRFPMEALDESALSEPAGLDPADPADEDEIDDLFVFYRCADTDLNTPGPQPGLTNEWPAHENVDWDCGDPFFHMEIDAGTVAADLNGDNDTTDVFAATPAEWPLLDYSAAGKIGP
jgi:hypothetical protein